MKKIGIFIISLSMILTNLLRCLSGISFAEGKDISSSVVKNVVIEKNSIIDGDRFKITVSFEGNRIGEASSINPGDKIFVKWSTYDEIKNLNDKNKGYIEGFVIEKDLNISSDKVGEKTVGKIVIKKDLAEITFNDNIKLFDEIKGSFFFEAQGRNNSREYNSKAEAYINIAGIKKNITIVKP